MIAIAAPRSVVCTPFPPQMFTRSPAGSRRLPFPYPISEGKGWLN
jgi:hypothetical protein